MNKADYIVYWKESAAKSWRASAHLFEKGDYVESLFFAHLALEKTLKSHWVANNSTDFPPRTHNLRMLAEQTNLNLPPATIAFLEQMNTFQMDGRYPDYRFAIYQAFDEPQTQTVLTEAEQLYLWLRSKLP